MLMKHIRLRLTTVFNILFNHQHVIVVSFTSKTLEKILLDEDVDISVVHIGLHKHQTYDILETIVENMDKIDVAMDRAKFEGEFEYRRTKLNEAD